MTVTAAKYLQKKVRWIIDLVQHEKMEKKRRRGRETAAVTQHKMH